MINRLEKYVIRYNEIIDLISDPSIVNDIKKMTTLLKEQRGLEKVVDVYTKYKKASESIADLKEMKKDSDPEISEMATIELDDTNALMAKLEDEIKILLIPKDPNDDKNVIVEIRGAAGGDEANIFAGDLFRMYSKYSDSKGWKIQIMDAMESEAGGFSQIQFMVNGDNAYSFLKFESGAHRVQRVPQTETMGRVHTSTATVLVMPEASEVEFDLNPNDLRFDTFCSSGPGGQSVNTTKSAVRVTHEPSGQSVACQTHKSQHENKAAAIALLKARMYDAIIQERNAKEGAVRQELIGNGDRSEKIRTYNYPQNRITDHRIGYTIQRLDAVIEGKVDLVIDQLIAEDQKRKLEGQSE